MKTETQTFADQLAETLRACGFTAIAENSDDPTVEDDVVDLTAGYHVQVSRHTAEYLTLWYEGEDEDGPFFRDLGFHKTVPSLLSHLTDVGVPHDGAGDPYGRWTETLAD